MSHHYIRFTDVHFSYPDGFEALRGVSFLLTHGERVALLGRNGAGKSTLLLLTNGLLLPSRGQVNIGDVPVGKKTLPIVRQSVGMVFQNPDDQLFMPTVEEDVAFGPLNMKLPPEEVERRVGMALDAVGASDLRKRSAMQLSGGQRRRVAIATVLSMEPSILVLDEPTSNLDFSARRDLIEVLKDFTHTQLIATHDLDMVRELCPRSIVIDKGRVVADGETTAILEDQKVLEILGIR
ncbi:MAG: energy-coupling factor ABC transporter ATP-binding protein [Muribaculaceae bacterium]|nr:energy-coupling factor ABC transporter ATP-binding protein [Muribaculaceae bacterium]